MRSISSRSWQTKLASFQDAFTRRVRRAADKVADVADRALTADNHLVQSLPKLAVTSTVGLFTVAFIVSAGILTWAAYALGIAGAAYFAFGRRGSRSNQRT
jgi:Flp pilus assembly protein TadB